MKAILFDLDGTLANSNPSILNAFKHMNQVNPDDNLLSTYIGPPLETTFLKLVNKLTKPFYIFDISTKILVFIKYLSMKVSKNC